MKVSVVVPVYNPGRDMDDCIRTLLDQSLPASAYELIFVDDGSTDATPARLDALAAEHPNVRVEHTENSGWSGRPRNIGMGLARGEYVYFVDNDDWLGHEALERLVAMADRDAADIVIGKVVGHGKSVPRNLFRRNRTGVGLDWEPLLWLLTPHKLFRRAFLEEHGLRFPEGRRRLEDHMMVLEAYFRSPRISVLADYPCYHWVLRDPGTNASWGRLDEDYFDAMSDVLDIVDAHTEPGPFRDKLYLRWYRGKVLSRLEKVLGNPDADVRQGLYRTLHDTAVARFPESVDALLPFNLALRSRLLRAGRLDELEALARYERKLRAEARALDVGDGTLRLEAELRGLRFAGTRWILPDGVTIEAPDAAPALPASTVQVLLKRRATQEEYRLPAVVTVRPESGGGVVLDAVATLDGRTAAAGAPLPRGMWEVHAMVIVAGFRSLGRVRRARGNEYLMVVAGADGVIREGAPGWRRRLRRRAPRRVVAALRSAQRRVRRR